MTAWGDIIASTERFPAVGRRHRLQLITDLVRSVDERGPHVQVELHSEDLRLMMAHFVPVPDGAEWIDALVSVLDVPTADLPHPDRWVEITDQYLEHRRAMDDLPVVDDPRG
jgi:hypothetical protein